MHDNLRNLLIFLQMSQVNNTDQDEQPPTNTQTVWKQSVKINAWNAPECRNKYLNIFRALADCLLGACISGCVWRALLEKLRKTINFIYLKVQIKTIFLFVDQI